MLTVVLAEDEKYVRKSIVNRVDWAGLSVHLRMEAETGTQALEAVRTLHPDVLITDIRMPQMDGLRVLETLRAENSTVACIIISGYGDFEYAQQAIRLGVLAFLTKPVDITELSGLLAGLSKAKKDEDDDVQTQAPQDQMEKVRQYLRAHFCENITGKHLSEHFFINAAHLSHAYKNHFGVGISQYLEELRVARAKELLSAGQHTKDVAFAVGYADVSYFIRVFKRRTGITPMAFTEQTRNTTE